MKVVISILMIVLTMIFLVGCNTSQPVVEEYHEEPLKEEKPSKTPTEMDVELEAGDEEIEGSLVDQPFEELVAFMEEKYENREPKIFGENIPGVYTSIDTGEKVVALTLDACGGTHGNGYDEELMAYLKKENIKATLFLNGRWIEANEALAASLAMDPLFEIENHGSFHKPLASRGQSIYGIQGTTSIAEILEEVVWNHHRIQNQTGKSPRYFRSGTAYYDDVALAIVEELGMKAVNFHVLGDAGATYSKEQMLATTQRVQEGSILLFHMNQPQSEIAQGIPLVVESLRAKGYTFVHLSPYDELLK